MKIPTGMYSPRLRVEEIKGGKNISHSSSHHGTTHDPAWDQRCQLVKTDPKRGMYQTSMSNMAL
jgi:hypothetical protein